MGVRNCTIERDELGPRVGNAIETRNENHQRAYLRLTPDDEIPSDHEHEDRTQGVEEIAQKIQNISEPVNAHTDTEYLVRENSRMLAPRVLPFWLHLSHFDNILPDGSLQDSSPAGQAIDRTLKSRYEQHLWKVDDGGKCRDLRLNPDQVSESPKNGATLKQGKRKAIGSKASYLLGLGCYH